MSTPMANQAMTIAQAAEKLGISTRTVRRYIKAGRIEARLVVGPFGEEYRIDGLPEGFASAHRAEAPAAGTPGRHLEHTPVQAMDIIRELQEKNLTLAAQLGAATERVRNLESQLKLLSAPRKRPWWRRIFSR